MSNEKASVLLRAIVGDEAWSAFDSIELAEPANANPADDGDNAAAVIPMTIDETGDVLPFEPIHVAATPSVEGAEPNIVGEPVVGAVSATDGATTGTEPVGAAEPAAKAGVKKSDLASDAAASDDKALAAGGTSSTEMSVEKAVTDEAANVEATADEAPLADLTAMVSMADFTSFLRMLQVAMVDIIPADAEAADEASHLDTFNGLFIDSDGHVITVFDTDTAHETLTAVTADGRTLSARLVSFDEARSLALLKVEADGPFDHVVLNDDAKALIASLHTMAEPEQGYLGVSIQPISADMMAGEGIEEISGVLISTVRMETAAEVAGLRPGDVIVKVDGTDIHSTDDAVEAIGTKMAGTKIDMVVWRDGAMMDIAATLRPRDLDQPSYAQPDVSDAVAAEAEPFDGLDIEPLGLRVGFGLEPGVEILDVSEGSEASSKGLVAGDVILRVAETMITEAADVDEAVKAAMEAGEPALLVLVRGPERGSKERYIALTLGGER